MTYEQQKQISRMLEGVHKDYLLTFLVGELGKSYGYDFEKITAEVNKFLEAVKYIEEKSK